MQWYRENIEIRTSKYIASEESGIIKGIFHGLEIKLDGYRVLLNISELANEDFTNYTIRLYFENQYVQYTIVLSPFGK